MSSTFICEKCNNTSFEQITYTQARCLQCGYLNWHDSGYKGKREFEISPEKDSTITNIKVSSERAPLIKRFVTLLIDIIFMSIIMSIVTSIANIEINYQQLMTDKSLSTKITGFMMVYYFISEYFFTKTIGKYFAKTHVVSLDGKRVSFIQCIIRSIVRFLPLEFLTGIIFQGNFFHDSLAKTKVVED